MYSGRNDHDSVGAEPWRSRFGVAVARMLKAMMLRSVEGARLRSFRSTRSRENYSFCSGTFDGQSAIGHPVRPSRVLPT